MRLRRLLFNKYSISVLILLLLLSTDIMLHKGMTRVMMPSGFSEFPVSTTTPCHHSINTSSKEWLKAINTIEKRNSIESLSGIESDVYFDKEKMEFFVYHDSSRISELTLDSLLYEHTMISAIWLDVKNLSGENKMAALSKLEEIRSAFNKPILVESPDAASLKPFCENGYATIVYAPFFNPYTEEESAIKHFAETMINDMAANPASAVSGYYFQYPFLKHSFPNYPVLTWSEKHTASAISYLLNRQLQNDSAVRIILYEQD